MQYLFFFSYASKNRDSYLMQFFEDLYRYVDLSMPLPANGETKVAFIDQRDIESGTEWNPALLEALQNSRMLVCAYSPHYFESDMCSREWHVFRLRHKSYRQNHPNYDAEPIAIKPVMWFPFEQQTFPEITRQAIFAIQIASGQRDAPVERNVPVEHMLRKRPRYAVEYEELIERIGKEIVSCNRDGPLLPVLEGIESELSEFPSLFPVPDWERSSPRGITPPLHFALISGAEAGPGRWRPFGDRTEPVSATLYSIASVDLCMTCEVSNLSGLADLPTLAATAEQRTQVLVVIIAQELAGALRTEELAATDPLVIVIGPPSPDAGSELLQYAPELRDLRPILNLHVPKRRSQIRSRSDVNLARFSMDKPSITASAPAGALHAN